MFHRLKSYSQRHWLRWTILFVVATIAFDAYTFVTAQRNHNVLCTFKSDLERRVDATAAFLDDHRGQVILGIPRATLENNLVNQRKTIDSLSGLSC